MKKVGIAKVENGYTVTTLSFSGITPTQETYVFTTFPEVTKLLEDYFEIEEA